MSSRNTAVKTDSAPLLRSPSARSIRPSFVDAGGRSQLNNLSFNDHRPVANDDNQSSSFFVMVTGSIESAKSLCTNEQLYCRYTYSYGPDWEVVHGVSMVLSQIARRGIVKSRDARDDESNVIVWNFPIEISFQSTNPYGWPRLALSIYGFDLLGRDILRGYASILIPINPGRHTKHLKIFRPVSGGKCQQLLNWIMGTSPEYYDSKMVTKGEGRGVTRVVSEDGMEVKVNLFVTRKDFHSFGFTSQSIQSLE